MVAAVAVPVLAVLEPVWQRRAPLIVQWQFYRVEALVPQGGVEALA